MRVLLEFESQRRWHVFIESNVLVTRLAGWPHYRFSVTDLGLVSARDSASFAPDSIRICDLSVCGPRCRAAVFTP